MTDRPIKRFIDIEIKKDTPRVSSAGFGVVLCLTDSATLTIVDRVKSFSTPQAVNDFFGDGAEYDFALSFFGQDPFYSSPEKLLFGRFLSGDETMEEAISAIEIIDNSWAVIGVVEDLRTDAEMKLLSASIESRYKILIATTNDVNTLTSGDTTTLAYYLKNLNYKRTVLIYYADSSFYPCAAWAGLQTPKAIGSTNWAYKTFGGAGFGGIDIPASSLTKDQIDACYSVNCNVYTETLSADFVHPGITCGGRNADKDGEYIDIIRNVDFLQARTEESLMGLLLEKDIIPMTDGGITIVENRLKSSLDTYGVKTGILEEGTVKVSFPKKSEISQTDRDDRLLPNGVFTADLTGGINKVAIRGTVSI